MASLLQDWQYLAIPRMVHSSVTDWTLFSRPISRLSYRTRTDVSGLIFPFIMKSRLVEENSPKKMPYSKDKSGGQVPFYSLERRAHWKHLVIELLVNGWSTVGWCPCLYSWVLTNRETRGKGISNLRTLHDKSFCYCSFLMEELFKV